MSAAPKISPHDAMRWTEAQFGQTRVWWRTYRHTAESILVGNMSLEAAYFLQHELDLLIARHPNVVGFHDWLDAPTYDTESRIAWQKWLSTSSFSGAHFLTASRLMQMGIIVANLAYPRVKFAVYAKRADYERARSAFMPTARRPV